MHSCSEHVDALRPKDHAVQFYGLDERALMANAGQYLVGGIEAGEPLLVIATRSRRAAFCRYLQAAGHDTDNMIERGAVILLDAEETLDRFMIGGHPDAHRFDAVVGTPARKLLGASKGLRAYGEMVGVLWAQGQYPAAIRLEQLWHRLISKAPFMLLCGYDIDLLDPDLEIGLVDALFCAHTHLLPGGAFDPLSTALERAMNEILGSRSDGIARNAGAFTRRGWSRLPQTEATIVFLRKNHPNEARSILARAREHYRSYSSPPQAESFEAAM